MPYRALTRMGKWSVAAYSDPDSGYLREVSASISLEDIVFDADALAKMMPRFLQASGAIKLTECTG